MSFVIKEKSNFIPAPEGVHNAVCVDIVEQKNVQTQWGNKDLVRIVWEIEEEMQNGKRFLVSNRYTPSLSVKSNLRKHLKSWRGKDFTAEELAGFDIEKLIGVSCQLVIVHAESKDGNIFANISTIIKAKTPLAPGGDYKRVKDRPETITASKSAASKEENQHEPTGDGSEGDNEIPF